jgi:hypothetical protein
MAIVLRSLYGSWVPSAAIAALLAIAGASVDQSIAHPRSAAVNGAKGGGSTAATNDLPVSDRGRRATAEHRSGPVGGQFCVGPHTDVCACRWRPVVVPSLDPSRLLQKIAHAQAEKAARVAHHTRMRVTRLQNGSILCCRDRPNAHIAAMLLDANDDTASDGDDTADDDDSQDDQNGDDDTESHIIVWGPATGFYLIAPERKATTSWIVPSFPPFLSLERLRC